MQLFMEVEEGGCNIVLLQKRIIMEETQELLYPASATQEATTQEVDSEDEFIQQLGASNRTFPTQVNPRPLNSSNPSGLGPSRGEMNYARRRPSRLGTQPTPLRTTQRQPPSQSGTPSRCSVQDRGPGGTPPARRPQRAASRPKRAFLVTYSQCDRRIFPTRESFATVVVEQLGATASAKPLFWACCLEDHKDAGQHYHLSVKLSAPKRWLAVKRTIEDRYGCVLNFKEHDGYLSAYRYVCKEGDEGRDPDVYHR